MDLSVAIVSVPKDQSHRRPKMVLHFTGWIGIRDSRVWGLRALRGAHVGDCVASILSGQKNASSTTGGIWLVSHAYTFSANAGHWLSNEQSSIFVAAAGTNDVVFGCIDGADGFGVTG